MTFGKLLHVEANRRYRAIRVISDGSLHRTRIGSRLDAAASLHILERKFAALYIPTSQHYRQQLHCNLRLTASTRSRDVLPAFCNPIIVTSISVALHGRHQYVSKPSAIKIAVMEVAERCKAIRLNPPRGHSSGWALFEVDEKKSIAYQNRLSSQSYTLLRSIMSPER